MFVAVDTHRGRAVTGADVAKTAPHQPADRQQTKPRYRCLICESGLAYTGYSDTIRSDSFQHIPPHDECIETGNVSETHRLGQEVTSQMLFNWVPGAQVSCDIDLERRIGGQSDFVIADVCVRAPVRLVVEIVYLSSHVSLRRRLRRLFKDGYAVMLVCLTSGRISPTRIEQHLQRIAPVRVGRFDPASLGFHFGTVLTPRQISLENPEWDHFPGYLS